MLIKKLAYLECSTGISGDMCLGALIHAGVPLTYLIEQLNKLGISKEFELRAESVQRNQQAATKVHVDLLTLLPEPHQHQKPLQQHDHTHGHTHDHTHHDHTHHDHTHHNHSSHTHDHSHTHDAKAHDHRHKHVQEEGHHHGHTHHAASRRLPEIEALIQQADLPERATQWSLATFRTLAEAEATVHGIPPEQVHFHEVGATDAIVDIVGTCLGFDWLGIDELICSPLPTGGGTVRCDHGLLPVPAPAVLAMLAAANVPVYSNGINKELVTPTGCAIATTLATSFGPPPAFTLTHIGLGAGGRNLALPNILRLWLGTSPNATHSTHQTHHTPPTQKTALEEAITTQALPVDRQDAYPPASSHPQAETVVHLQTQIDDASPQAIGYLFEQLFTLGALDVYTQPVAMKKNRLGTLLTVICAESSSTECEALIFRESTTLGIRRTPQTRTVLTREMVTVSTPYGDIPAKIARSQAGGIVLNVQPEYDDCARVAKSKNIPWKQVHQAAMKAASELTSESTPKFRA